MANLGTFRTRLLLGVAAVAAVAVALILVVFPSKPAVVVSHWANVHMMNPALLPHFAEDFNRENHHTRSGAPIRIDLTLLNSGVMLDEMVSRAGRGIALDPALANPTIITPAADHWLGQINHAVGRDVVDPAQSRTIAVTWVGIVTYKEMAECLGWPQKEIGFADVVAVAKDPRGWATCPNAKAEWGQQPLLSFTDPSSSSTARAMLYALFSIAAHKQPEQLTEADVANPDVLAYVRAFNGEVDHYVYDTATLNSKIYLGPRYGHFYFIAESNLVQLYQGKLAVTVGAEQKRQPLNRQMVFIYPKEGAVAHNHSVSAVQASWVTPDQAEAAQQWTDYLRDDARQRAFMEEGFRPATKIPLAETIGPRFGLDPSQPIRKLNTDAVAPAAADAIVNSWEDVKKPGVAIFVADVSGSMNGSKLNESKKGLARALDGMAPGNQVGLITFSSGITTRIDVGPLSENRFILANAVDNVQARGNTALYDAIKAGIEMADAAPGDQEAIRGVVVLTDGEANAGSTQLDDLVTMTARDEAPIGAFSGMATESAGVTADGRRVDKADIIGESLALHTRHRIHVFYIGIGDADPNTGRIFAEATGSSYLGTTEKDLAKVLEQFGKYF